MYILKSHELTDLESFVLWRGYFSDPVYVQTYEQQISFCYHLPCSVTLLFLYYTVSILKIILYFTCSSIMEILKVH